MLVTRTPTFTAPWCHEDRCTSELKLRRSFLGAPAGNMMHRAAFIVMILCPYIHDRWFIHGPILSNGMKIVNED